MHLQCTGPLVKQQPAFASTSAQQPAWPVSLAVQQPAWSGLHPMQQPAWSGLVATQQQPTRGGGQASCTDMPACATAEPGLSGPRHSHLACVDSRLAKMCPPVVPAGHQTRCSCTRLLRRPVARVCGGSTISSQSGHHGRHESMHVHDLHTSISHTQLESSSMVRPHATQVVLLCCHGNIRGSRQLQGRMSLSSQQSYQCRVRLVRGVLCSLLTRPACNDAGIRSLARLTARCHGLPCSGTPWADDVHDATADRCCE